MFCVECGREGPIFREGACLDCYLKTHKFSKGPATIDLPTCAHCSSYKYKNTWTSDLFGETLRRLVKNTFQISKELKKIDINTECKETKEGMACKVIISGYLDDLEINEEHEILVRMKKTVCEVCSKRFGGYHEAIVQIRADKIKLSKAKLDIIRSTIENLVENLRSNGNRNLFITDISEEHGGINFYLSDKNFGHAIAKKIQEQYGGNIKQSSKNIGMKDSRQVYRMTYLLRLPEHQKGDFFSYGDSFFYISSISGDKVHVIDLSSWVKGVFDEKSLRKVHIFEGKEHLGEMILVSQSKDELQAMNSKSYEIKVIRKPKPISFTSEKIRVVIIKDHIFLFPEKVKMDI